MENIGRNSVEQKCLDKRGWYAHRVRDSRVPTLFNYHTHGFQETLGHMDVQIILPVEDQICHSIATAVFERIRKGASFREGELAHGLVRYPVGFICVQEDGREVLRLILPDKNGEIEPLRLNENEPDYSFQWIDVGLPVEKTYLGDERIAIAHARETGKLGRIEKEHFGE